MNLIVDSIDGDEPITLTQAKEHCYVTSTDSDVENILNALITATREYAESYTWRTIPLKTYKLKLDCFPVGEIRLKRPPFKSLTSIEYVDTDENTQTLAASNYQTDLNGGRVRPADSWPSTYDTYEAVTITYVAGYDETTPELTLPKPMNSGMLLLLKHLFDNRDAVVVSDRASIDAVEIPLGVKSLLGMYSASEVA